MIVSHEHEFVFLKTRKTAGTSVEIALSRFCGPDDIITPVSERDEELRRRLGARGPQNDEDTPDGRRVRNHMQVQGVRSAIGKETWDRYFTFTIERNPWDMVVSLYSWIYRDVEPVPFRDFLVERLPSATPNAAIYRLGGKVAVDKVCLYESLVDDLAEVYDRIGLPGPPELPNAKAGWRDGRHYRDWYGPTERELVAERFATTIEEFGYEF